MNMEHVEVLRDLSEVCRAAIKAGDWKVDGACDPDAVLRRADAAIASLSAQPPAEAQPCGCGEATCTVPWEPGCGLGKSEQHAVVQAQPLPNGVVQRHVVTKFSDGSTRVEEISTAPSAPVGVEWAVIVEGLRLADQFFDGDDNHWQWDDGEAFPASKVRTAYQAALAQQPAAVDEAMVERALTARAGAWTVRQLFADEDEAPDIMRIALTAALAQPGGSDNDR